MTTLSRVVILGASGHIGSALQGLLRAKGDVEVVGHGSKTLDLRRPEALDTLDAVAGPEAALVFAAALTPDRGQTVATFMQNVEMAANVSRGLERVRFGHVVYVSSDAVYGFDVNPVDETTPVEPGGYYALAKYTGEKLMEYGAKTAAVPLLTVRVAGVYGPGDPHGAYGPNAFARTLAKDRTLRLFGAGEEERDHIYVDDVARSIAALLRAGATGVYNVVTGESRSFAAVVAAIRALVRYDVAVTHAARKSPVTHRRYDAKKLRDAAPDLRLTPFDEGLRATLTAFGAL